MLMLHASLNASFSCSFNLITIIGITITIYGTTMPVYILLAVKALSSTHFSPQFYSSFFNSVPTMAKIANIPFNIVFIYLVGFVFLFLFLVFGHLGFTQLCSEFISSVHSWQCSRNQG